VTSRKERERGEKEREREREREKKEGKTFHDQNQRAIAFSKSGSETRDWQGIELV
jgi:hypothetical protein